MRLIKNKTRLLLLNFTLLGGVKSVKFCSRTYLIHGTGSSVLVYRSMPELDQGRRRSGFGSRELTVGVTEMIYARRDAIDNSDLLCPDSLENLYFTIEKRMTLRIKIFGSPSSINI